MLEPALHVLTEPDHLVACLAIGLLVGQRPSREQFLSVLGGFTGAFIVAFWLPGFVRIGPAFESIDAFASAMSLIAVGLLVAVPRAGPPALAVTIALATGAVHGLANGLGLPEGESHLIAAAFVGGAATLAAVVGAVLARLFKAPWGVLGVRVLGSWAAALGLILFGIALR